MINIMSREEISEKLLDAGTGVPTKEDVLPLRWPGHAFRKKEQAISSTLTNESGLVAADKDMRSRSEALNQLSTSQTIRQNSAHEAGEIEQAEEIIVSDEKSQVRLVIRGGGKRSPPPE